MRRLTLSLSFRRYIAIMISAIICSFSYTARATCNIKAASCYFSFNDHYYIKTDLNYCIMTSFPINPGSSLKVVGKVYNSSGTLLATPTAVTYWNTTVFDMGSIPPPYQIAIEVQ